MASMGNAPEELVVMRLEARKSFSYTVQLRDAKKLPLDITGCRLSFVMKTEADERTSVDDSENVVVNYVATIDDPLTGTGRFDFQATDLEAKPGEYPFAIVLWTADGYSAVIVKGIVDLQQNTEFESLGESFNSVQPAQDITVSLSGRNVIDVEIGGMLPPGMNYMTDQEKEDLAQLVEDWLNVELGTAAFENVEAFAPAEAGVPTGGVRRYVLTKTTSADYDTMWLPLPDLDGTKIDVVDHDTYTLLIIGGSTSVDDGGGTLDAVGVPAGWIPTASGIDSWGWSAPAIPVLDTINDTANFVKMTPAERTKLSGVQAGAEANVRSDWNAASGDAQILNKPSLGSAAARNESYFAKADHTHFVMDLDGIDWGYDEPSGIPEDGQMYLRVIG